MKNNIQYIIFGIFGLAIVGAVLLFALNIDVRGTNTLEGIKGNVVIWGTMPAQTIRNYTDQVATNDLRVIYKQVDADTFDQDIINAWASGEGPDMILADHETLLRHNSKLFHVPYSSFSEIQYKSLYADIADLFLNVDGILGFPLLVDPMVTYYNRNILSSSFITSPPATWEEIEEAVPIIGEFGETGILLKSTVALGTHNNIKHAKDILAGIIMQMGNRIVGEDISGQQVSLIYYDLDFGQIAQNALDFYISFADPENNNYSWNESLPMDMEAFLFGDLAMYFGYASELTNIRNTNPNLNFAVSFFPQFEIADTKITFGKMYALAISKLSKNIPASVAVASKMSSPEILEGLYNDLLIPPARKSILSQTTGLGAEETLFYQSAIISRAWYDPNSVLTNIYFTNMIKNITSGINTVESAVSRLHADIASLLRDI